MPNHFYELAVENINSISFATADNPFVKSGYPKYYPEILVLSGKGEILAQENPFLEKKHPFKHLNYLENFRDESLKINDDKKVVFNLSEFADPETTILMLVKTYEKKN